MIASVAVVTDLGGSTSHAAVVTRALGRPSVVGVGDGVAESLEGKVLTVDGAAGRVYEGELPLQATRIEDHAGLARLSQWAQEHCPIEVRTTGEVVDLDASGVGLDAETGRVDVEALKLALTSSDQPLRGSVLNTAEGVSALLESGVTSIVADPALPLQLRIIQTSAKSA
jgi:pyruvate,orthophosphate dikinase